MSEKVFFLGTKAIPDFKNHRLFHFQGDPKDAADRFFELIYPYGLDTVALYREMNALINHQLSPMTDDQPGEPSENVPDAFIPIEVPESAIPVILKRFESADDWGEPDLRKPSEESADADADA